jgi:branched-subunit amino acid ABC-type transport system permease component
MTLIVLVCLFVVFYLINQIVIRSFANEDQRHLFGLIFSFGAAHFIENISSVIYWSNAISVNFWSLSIRWYIALIVIITGIGLYCFHLSYRGKIRQAISIQSSSVRALGVRVNHLFHIAFTCLFPVVIGIGVMIANESAIKPSDNLFYLIKAIGIMILVGVEKKQYIYLGTLLYVTLEYILFITWWFPISYKETLILVIILIVLLRKPQGLFSLRTRNI